MAGTQNKRSPEQRRALLEAGLGTVVLIGVLVVTGGNAFVAVAVMAVLFALYFGLRAL